MALKFNFESLDNKLPKRDINSHKGNNGRVLIVAGSEGMGGAGILASEASLFSGSGLVSLFTHKSNVSASLERNPEIMALGIDDCIEYSNNLDVLLIGPGLGSDKWSKLMSKYLDQVNKNICLVVDAGGLSFLKSTPLVLECKSTILTPHPGEAANLLDTTVEAIQGDRENSAKKIAEKYGVSAVILKGHKTVVFLSGTDRTFVSDIGGPELSSAGTGDVLAGILSALLAQNMNLEDACLLAVAVHSKAGINFKEDIGEIGLNASALIPLIRKLLNQ